MGTLGMVMVMVMGITDTITDMAMATRDLEIDTPRTMDDSR